MVQSKGKGHSGTGNSGQPLTTRLRPTHSTAATAGSHHTRITARQASIRRVFNHHKTNRDAAITVIWVSGFIIKDKAARAMSRLAPSVEGRSLEDWSHRYSASKMTMQWRLRDAVS